MQKVSIIIPTYKRADKIERAIKSATNQTYKNIEIIVVDDNSEFPSERKKTTDIVKKYPKVILIQNKKNLGGGLTRNEGIKKSTGEFIAFLDDDDEYHPQKIEEQVALFNKLKNSHKIGLVYCYQQVFTPNGKKKHIEKCDHEGHQLFNHMKHSLMPTSCWLCPKTIFNQGIKFENVKSQQDATILLRILGAGYEVFRVPKPLVNFYLHDNHEGISTYNEQYIKNIEEYHKKCREYFGQFSKSQQKELEYYFKNRIFNYYFYFDKKKSWKTLLEMFKIYPLKVNNYKKIIKLIIK